MSGSDVIARRAARVLVVDEAERVLMFRGCDPAHPEVRFWLTAGGGVHGSETLPEAAARELAEETGLRVTPAQLGEPVFEDVSEFSFNGRRYRQEQTFFLLRVPAWEVDHSGAGEVEHVSVDMHRWWTPAELVDAPEPVYPPDLPQLLRRLGVG